MSDGYPQIPQNHECTLNSADIAAYERAVTDGDLALAGTIKEDVEQRIARCMGQVGTTCGVVYSDALGAVSKTSETEVVLGTHQAAVTRRTQMGFK